MEECAQKGLLHYVTLATKFLHVFLFHEDITQKDLKNSRLWYTCGLSPHRVLAISVHYFWRYEHFSERQKKWRKEKCSYLLKWCTDMAITRCGLRSHVYQWLEFFFSSCVMSSWSKTTSNSFVTKGELMQQPLLLESLRNYQLRKKHYAEVLHVW